MTDAQFPNRELRITARPGNWWAGIELLVEGYDIHAKKRFVLESSYKEVNRYERLEPSFTMDPKRAQELMDSLWASGLRPTEGAGTAGAMAATQRHLGDLRQILFETLGIEKPK